MGSDRSRSYSPRRRSRTPPPRYRKRHDDGGERRDRRSPDEGPVGLLVRNLPLDARPDDLRIPFERFGPVKDVYLPKNYYTREPRGFGFVKYSYAVDAAEAKQHLNHSDFNGREMRIEFAEENRKTPGQMRFTSRPSGRHGGSYRRRTPPRSQRRHSRSYSRSPSPARVRRHRDVSERSHSISQSLLHDNRDYRNGSPQYEDRDYSRFPNPQENGKIPVNGKGYERSRSRSPQRKFYTHTGSRSPSYSPR